RHLINGAKEKYEYSDGATSPKTFRRIFLSEIIDSKGNSTNFTYETITQGVRLTKITDPLGKETKLFYEKGDINNANDMDVLLVTKIEDPFFRSVKIIYDANGRIISLTDAELIETTFTYDTFTGTAYVMGETNTSDPHDDTDPGVTFSATYLKTMTTPYGATTFNYGENYNPNLANGGPELLRWIEITGPDGLTERTEFTHTATGIPQNDVMSAPVGMAS